MGPLVGLHIERWVPLGYRYKLVILDEMALDLHWSTEVDIDCQRCQ